MADVVLRGAEVVDGTGAPRVRADVALADGRIERVAPDLDPQGARTVDLDGMVVMPGVVDLHTHYDAQLLWDPYASPSPLHGVTTVIGGNCGFTIAPMAPEHVDYVRRMMATVEGMPLSALESGPAWDWTDFGSWLARLDGRLAVNAGFLAGHSTIRRLVMGDDAVSAAASSDQLAAMAELLDRSLAEGALGFSSSNGPHLDGNGDPVPSRASDPRELVFLAQVASRHPGTTLEFIPGMGEIGAETADLMADMSLAAGRPLNWNLLGNLSPVPIYAQQLTASDAAERRGATVVALTLPDIMKMRQDQMLESLPGWREFLALPLAERRRLAADPAPRSALKESAGVLSARGLGAAEAWDMIEIGPADDGSSTAAVGRSVAEVAAERGVEPLDVVIDDVAGHGLHLTLLFGSLEPTLGRSPEGWAARAKVWRDPRVVLGGSDAGAHLDLMCHANYPTVVLGEAVRERGLLGFEEAVHLLTQVPAALYGLRGRGTVAEGQWADLVALDPETVGTRPTYLRPDLPGGGGRLYAEAQGIELVWVNGRPVVEGGRFTEARVGRVLRSGADTVTVALS